MRDIEDWRFRLGTDSGGKKSGNAEIFNHNQAPGRVLSRLPKAARRVRRVGTSESNGLGWARGGADARVGESGFFVVEGVVADPTSGSLLRKAVAMRASLGGGVDLSERVACP